MKLTKYLSCVICPAIFVLTVLAGTAFGLSSKTYGNIYNAKYVDNLDGHVIIFDIPGVHPLIGDKVKVCLRGVDLPEIVARCDKERELARQARDIVRWLLHDAKSVVLQDVGRDRLFRLTAIVLADGKDIRQVLINKGLAVPLNGPQKRNWCE